MDRSSPPDRNAVLEALDNVTRAITSDLGPKVAALRADQNTLRRQLRLTIGSLIADVILTLATVVATMVAFIALNGAQRNQATIAELHAGNVSACQLGNQTRAAEVALWEHVAAISKPQPGESAAQRRRRAQVLAAFLTYVHKTFAPRDCAAIYRLP